MLKQRLSEVEVVVNPKPPRSCTFSITIAATTTTHPGINNSSSSSSITTTSSDDTTIVELCGLESPFDELRALDKAAIVDTIASKLTSAGSV